MPNGRWVNSFRYGLDTDRQADSFDSAELGGGLGYLDVAVAGVQLGPATYLPRVEPLEVRNEFADDVSWAKGKHVFKVGLTFEHVQDNVNYLSNRFGSYTYPTVTSFALDYTGNTAGAKNYSAFTQTFGNPMVNYAIKDLGMYLMDQWKVNDRLTVTLGARYEYTFMPPPAQTNPLFPLTGESLPSGTRDLAPRIGVAYRLNSKTVIRGGAGTFFARQVSGILDDVYTGNGIYQISDSLSNATLIAQGPTFPNALAAPLTTITQGSSTLDVLSPNLKTPYSEQATIAVERQIAKDMVVTVSGIFSRGVNLWGTQDINAPALGAPFTYTIDNAIGNGGRHLHHRSLHRSAAESEFRRHLRGNQRRQQLVRRAGGGLRQALLAWIPVVSVVYLVPRNRRRPGRCHQRDLRIQRRAWTYNGNYGFDKGSGSLDQRQRFVYSFVWAP